jgi:hypothetical protein
MANNDEQRWMQRFENLEKANKNLTAACALNQYSELELAGLIKSFEMAFELAWKTLKDLLFYEGYELAARSNPESVRNRDSRRQRALA